MKRCLLFALLISSCAFAQTITPPSNATVFANLDDSSSGWGQCTGSCAGGTTASTYYIAQFQTTPSLDGSSTNLHVDGPAWTDALFWNKLGPHNNYKNFQTDFWFMVDKNASQIGQALEFDTFQFNSGTEYMFGTQCDYATGTWDVWNQKQGRWISLSTLPCAKFAPDVWYHITWSFHRTSRKQVSYDSLRVMQYDSTGTVVVADHAYSVNMVELAGPMPSGWSDDMGVQFQTDLNGQAGTTGFPSTVNTWIEKVTLTAW